MHSKTLQLVVVLCAACLFALRVGAQHDSNLQSKRTIPHADLENREWHIAQYYVHDELLSPHPQLTKPSKPYIRFAHGTMEGSPGCGHFIGTYTKIQDRLTIAATWSQETQASCNEGEKDDAAKMLVALGRVRRLADPPSYWQDDALLLNDAQGKLQVTLAPKQAGNDLSDLPTAYWRLVNMKGSQANLSHVVVHITDNDVSFSTPTCFFAFPYEYEMAGLRFSPAWSQACGKAPEADALVAKSFENNLHSIQSYQLGSDTLTFFDHDRHMILTLAPIAADTFENRVWRVQKYLAASSKGQGAQDLINAKSLATIALVNGRAEGGPGCGAWMGGYELSGNHFTLHAGVLLAGLCYRESQVQSQSVEKAFQGDLQIVATHDQIILRDNKGQTRIQLTPY